MPRMKYGFLLFFVLPAMLLGVYVLSILWRVSVAEMELFGSSKLIPIKAKNVYFPGPNNAESFFNNTYWFNREGQKELVWTDKINCFQHVYGSALTAHELGSIPAHLLFCANEFAEFSFDWNGVSTEDLLDRRKDLAHNEVGRNLASKIENLELKGKEVELQLQKLVLEEMKSSSRVYLSYTDPRVSKLPTEDQLGCAFLPKKNIFNYIKDGVSDCKIWSKTLKNIASQQDQNL